MPRQSVYKIREATERARIETINIRQKILGIHEETEHDLHKIIYGLHGGGTLEYYNYYGTRVSNQYRHAIYNSHPDSMESTEYILAGFIGKHDLFT